MKKSYKPSKVDILNFVKGDKKGQKGKEGDSYLFSEISSLDSESVSLLRRLLKFTDKD
jgi:hypothetical protein